MARPPASADAAGAALPLEGVSKDLLEAAPDAMIVVGTDGRIVWLNSQALLIFGYAREDLLQHPIELLLPDQIRARHAEHRATYGENPRLRPMGTGFDLVARHRSGSEFPVEISLSPLRLESSLLVIASVRDITERKRLESEKDALLRDAQRARAEAEEAREAMARVHAITEVAISPLSVDDMLHGLLGRVRALLEVDMAAVLLLDEAEQGLRLRAMVGEDGDSTIREAALADGLNFARRVAVAAKPVAEESDDRSRLGTPLLAEGELLGVFEVGASGRRAFGEDEIRLLQLVADRVALSIKRARLYEAEQTARAAAESSLRAREEIERLKDELTSMVVHDLKNPVNGILMMVELSLRKGADLPTSHQERLRQIAWTCGEMTRLIQNLLEISKMEDGRMPIAREVVSLRAIVEEVVHEYRPVAEQMTRRLHPIDPAEPEVLAIADRALIKRVVINLVVNALRHSGSTDVWVKVARDPNVESVTLRVVDHGRGILDADRARVFEKFAVVRRSIGDPSGDTGLGLPFCKMAMERMGGRVELESAAEETVFTITLPAADDGA